MSLIRNHAPYLSLINLKGKSERGLYGDVIMEIDWSVGEILKALKKNDIDENTLVIFTSDNGPWLSYGEHAASASPLREGKQTTWEGGQREPCIMRYPGKLPEDKVVKTPLMAIDILPTIAAITGAKLPEKIIDGENVWDVLTGLTEESPHEAYFFYYNVNELQGVRYKNWKMYYPRTYKSLNGRAGGKNGLPVDYHYNAVEKIQLYNLSNDVSESHDLAGKYLEIISKIDSLAKNMRFRLGDSSNGITGSENRVAGKIAK